MMQEQSDKFASKRSMFKSVIRCAYCVLVLFVVLTNSLPSGSEPVINTQWGPIRGKWSMSLNNRPIANFLGIPYALPPLGDLRFKSPQRWNHTWTTVRDGTVDRSACSQVVDSKIVGSEDCLYLNIFVPMIPGNQPTGLPVLIFVHGGLWLTGSSNSKQYAPDYLLEHDIILVTLNYRLDVFGFFSTMNRAAPGNYGLKDVRAALHWVQENIHNFEGNPGSVTVMGSSSGAILIQLLALSDKSKGLFHRYILHNGSALSWWCAVHPGPLYRKTCLEIARIVGCLPTEMSNATNDTIFTINSGQESAEQCSYVFDTSDDNVKQDEEMMKCMRTVDKNELLGLIKNFHVWRSHPYCIMSTVVEEESEDAVVTMHPLKIMKNQLFRNMPAIIQVTKDEGLLKSIDFIIHPEIKNEMIENFEQYLPYLTDIQGAISNTSVFADAIRDFYFNGNLTESSLINNITEMIGDGIITSPAFQSVQYLSKVKNAKIYLSLFDYQETFSWTFKSGSPTLYGVSHADDLNYFFPILNNIFEDRMLHNTENDRKMINIMTEMWTNFVKDGVPRAWTIPAWPVYRDHHQFMRFGIDGSPDIAVQADFLSTRMEFWEKMMANISTECNMGPVMLTNDSPDDTVTAIGNTIDYRLTLDIVLITMAFFAVFM